MTPSLTARITRPQCRRCSTFLGSPGDFAMNDITPSFHEHATAVDFSIAGSGEPIVLLHSSMSHKGQWSELTEDLAGKHRTIAIDLVGYGNAPNLDTSSRVTLDDEAKRVQTILHRVFGHTPMFHLIGHSYGGGVALRLARNLPHRVASLALFEPTAFHVLPDGDIGRDEIEQVVAVMKWALEGGAP